MATANDVLWRASKEIGYSRWNDPLQGTIYGRWYAKHTGSPYFGMNGVPYCAMFVSYILAQVGQACPGFPTAGCGTALNGARNAGVVISNKRDARPGDIVIFDWSRGSGTHDHVGFVELNKGGYIQTIEGNTSPGNSGSQGNGGGVYRRTRDWGVVQAIIRPPYSNTSAPVPSPDPSGKLVVDGYLGNASISELQRQLGCSIVDGVITDQDPINKPYLPNVTAITWTADGGSNAALALQNFLIRKGYSISADRYIGPKTVLALQQWMTRDLGYTKHGHDSILGAKTAANVQNALNIGAFK